MSPAQIGALASGLALAVLGGLLLAHQEGAIDLAGGWLIVLVTALSGAALIASGLAARRG